ncbi:MAG TPA: SDR family oxidoreductase [Clostridiales bacterium]|nr:SDR family oxidoreductase [Clostridiales bacterium]
MSKTCLKDMTALVTGGSRGIGRAVARKLADHGVNLMLVGRNLKKLEAVQRDLSTKNVKVFFCVEDLADAQAPARIIRETVERLGGLDILINNAAVGMVAPLTETSVEQWDRIMAVNARAPFLLSKEAIPYLRKSRCSSIINISSVVGYKGYINQGAYTASKHALMGMTKVLAQEVYKDNIRVHVISPGGVDTEMLYDMRPDLKPSEVISPDEIADIVMFLLTHRGNGVIDEINIRRVSNSPWK